MIHMYTHMRIQDSTLMKPAKDSSDSSNDKHTRKHDEEETQIPSAMNNYEIMINHLKSATMTRAAPSLLSRMKMSM